VASEIWNSEGVEIMLKYSLFVFAIGMFLLPSFSVAAGEVAEQKMNSTRLVQATTLSLDEDEVVWLYDFEDPDGLENWIFTDPASAPHDNHWSIDTFEPHGGENSWRCFDPDVGSEVYGGYDNDWMQMLTLPAQDFSAVTIGTLDFWFRCVSEAGNWDGATMLIAYGPDVDNLTYEIPTPNAGFGDYDETNIREFARFWPGFIVPGWASVDEYTNAIFDLSAYVGNAYVRISFAFASDGSYNSINDETYFGFQVDDILLDLDGTVVFANDAESGQGDIVFLNGGDASTIDPVPNVFGLFEPDGAPSATHAIGIEDYDPNWIAFDHFAECPSVFDAVELEFGESQYFDFAHRGDWESDGDDQSRFIFQIYTPDSDRWNFCAWESGSYWYWGVPLDWTNAANYLPYMGMNTVGTQDGIKFRISWHNGVDGFTGEFGGMYWDNLAVMKHSIQHDIETNFGLISYPTTIGYPVVGEVIYSNNGLNDESFVGLWGFSPPSWPVYPDGTNVTVAVDEITTQYISTINSNEGAWVPTSSGETTISATHLLTGDVIPDNDLATTDLTILEENNFELGYDFRTITHLSTAHPVGGGPITYFTPVTDEIVDPATHTFNIIEYQFKWYGNGGNGDIRIHVGTTAGASDIWTSDPISLVADSVIMDFVLDLSGTTELEGLSGDFYVWTELLTEHADGHGIPSPLRTISEVTFNDHHFDYDGTTATETDSDWNVNVVVEAVEISSVDPSDALPTDFALNNAYPNPFNPTTMLTYDVAKLSDLSIKVYNLMGQEIATLFSGVQTIGRHSLSFDASNLSSGVYFVRMQADGFNAMQKILLMK
jgi:Secretion system C-terminal sorting domain/Immune inhibitor A-like, MAM domain